MPPLNESDVIRQIAEALVLEPGALSAASTSRDFPAQWDSMGTMAIVIMLDSQFDLKLRPGETDRLQSVAGILQLLRDAGKVS